MYYTLLDRPTRRIFYVLALRSIGSYSSSPAVLDEALNSEKNSIIPYPSNITLYFLTSLSEVKLFGTDTYNGGRSTTT